MINKWINISRRGGVLVNGLLFSLFAFIGRGISFLLLIILASYIPPFDYGKLSLFNTVIMVIGFFMAFSSNGYFSISYFKEDAKTFKQDFTSIFILLIISFAIISVIILTGGSFVSDSLGLNINHIWIALWISFFTVIFQMHLDYFRVKEKVWKYGFLSVLNASMNAALSLILVIEFMQGWEGRVDAHLCVSIFLGIIALYYFFNEHLFNKDIQWSRVKFVLVWGIPQIPHLATAWIRQGCDQYIINYFYSSYEVGIFGFALNIISVITMIGLAFNSSNSVSIYKTLSDKALLEKMSILKSNTKKIGLVYVLITILVVVFARLLIPFLLPKYSDCIPYLFILSIYGLFTCFYFLFCNYLFYYGRTKQLMFITFGSSLFHLCLSLLLTRYSLFYTCTIYVLSQMTCVGIVYFYSKKILSLELCIH